MPPRIAYWVSSFEPEMEAVAGEVACLRRAFPGSVAWGVSPRNWVRLSWRRGIGVHPRLHLVFRAMTRVMQHAFSVNHIVGGVGDWFHLTAARKRPIVLTVCLPGPVCDARLLGKVDQFVVEWPGACEDLEKAGVERERIRVIFPPVDLERFSPAAAPAGPFTVTFASSPEKIDWLEARGVHVILEAAALCREMRFRLVWRPWGESLPEVRRWIKERWLSNVELLVGRFTEMANQYQAAHVCVAPFTDPSRCKGVPNSLLESLACGRPIVATPEVGLARVVEDERAGVVCTANAESLAQSLEQIACDWEAYSRRARELAERRFAWERFVEAYDHVYKSLIGCHR